MYKEWLTAKELLGLQGLPMTTQGINAMARRENWVSRKGEVFKAKRWSTILVLYLSIFLRGSLLTKLHLLIK